MERDLAEQRQNLSPSSDGHGQYEVITVLVRQEDYVLLKKDGGPRSDQIAMALGHYLALIREARWQPEMSSKAIYLGKIMTFKCAVSKKLYEEIRALGGRLDHHTIEAVRLFLL
jgi:hypothetical protein